MSSSDSSDDDIFRRNKKRPVKYGSGIQLIKNKKKKADIWGDSSSDEDYASGSDSGKASDVSDSYEDFEDAEEEEEKEKEASSDKEKGPKKDAFSAKPVGGATHSEEKYPGDNDEESKFDRERSNFYRQEIDSVIDAETAHWIKEKNVHDSTEEGRERIADYREKLISQFKNLEGPLYNQFMDHMKEMDAEKDKKIADDIPAFKQSKKSPLTNTYHDDPDTDEVRLNNLYKGLPNNHPELKARKAANRRFGKQFAPDDDSLDDKEYELNRSRENLRGHHLRSYEMQLIHESDGMRDLGFKFNNVRTMSNRSLEDVLAKARKSESDWKGELKNIYHRQLHSHISHPVRADWDAFLAAGMRERESNLKQWYRENQEEEFPFSDDDTKSAHLESGLDESVSSQSEAAAEADDAESGSEVEEQEEAPRARRSREDSIFQADSLDLIMDASKEYVEEKGANNMKSKDKIKILEQLKKIVSRYPDNKRAPPFQINASGRITRGRGIPQSKFAQIDTIKTKLKALRRQ